MKFSICTPITLDRESVDNYRMPRYEMFLRCANSVFGQTYDDFEWVIADDIANPPIEEILEEHDSWWKPRGRKVKIVLLPEKSGRIAARNVAMEASSGEWICWLDGDDEYASFYLQAMADAIKLHPKYKIFNFNHMMFPYAYDSDVHIRRFIDMEQQGDKPFKSGVIGAGAFIFHRDVYKDIGNLPELGLWEFAEKAFEDHPEIKPLYWNEHKQSHDSLGNPWGEDWFYFYKMTRKHKAKYLNIAPYYVHSRWGHRWSDDPDYVVDPGKKPNWSKKNQ